ncbi:hypothetical protein LCGC14_1688500 [marine sediment metagenome]|uniref:Methyltransferase FkbM domain-containing protein n=1 Tax=marine sediment metagenome TaxID=412755 RepID=A0A0F9KLL4_9ZZZZ
MQSWGQNKEDLILLSLFRDQKTGFFVDVGAFDGIKCSNSYLFEKLGWNGICIEPHPDYFPALEQNRNCICIQACASNFDGSVTFFAHPNGDNSTIVIDDLFDFRRKDKRKAMNRDDYTEIETTSQKLDTILTKYNVTSIDLMSIDVECAELQVLQGFDICKYQPRVLVLEANIKEYRKTVHNYMNKYNYHRGGRIKQNVFYCQDEADASTINEHLPKKWRKR